MEQAATTITILHAVAVFWEHSKGVAIGVLSDIKIAATPPTADISQVIQVVPENPAMQTQELV